MGHKWVICESHPDCSVGQWVNGSTGVTLVFAYTYRQFSHIATCLIYPIHILQLHVYIQFHISCKACVGYNYNSIYSCKACVGYNYNSIYRIVYTVWLVFIVTWYIHSYINILFGNLTIYISHIPNMIYNWYGVALVRLDVHWSNIMACISEQHLETETSIVIK